MTNGDTPTPSPSLFQGKKLLFIIPIAIIFLCCMCFSAITIFGFFQPPEFQLESHDNTSWVAEEPNETIHFYCSGINSVTVNEDDLSQDEVNKICSPDGYSLQFIDGENSFEIVGRGLRGQEIKLTLSISFDEDAYNQQLAKIEAQREKELEEERIRQEKEAIVDTIDEFKNSDFYKQYQFYDENMFELNDGRISYGFYTDEFGYGVTGIEIVMKDGKFTDIGASFVGKANMQASSYDFIEEFIKLMSNQDDVSIPMEFIRKNIVIQEPDPNKSLMDTTPITWENFELRASRIGMTSYLFNLTYK